MKLAYSFALLALAAPGLAMAATEPQNDSFQVALDLQNRCTIDIDDLSFGTHNTLANDIETRSEMRIRCTGISPSLLIQFDGGGAGDFNNRRMSDGNGNTINYVFSTIQGWGQIHSHGFYGFGQNLTWPVYGVIPGGQNPKPAGTYSDTLVATVTF